jgi:hypothetical protein
LDFVAALFALADYVCDAAEYAFAFLSAAFVAVKDVGAEAKLKPAGSWFICLEVFSLALGEIEADKGEEGGKLTFNT